MRREIVGFGDAPRAGFKGGERAPGLPQNHMLFIANDRCLQDYDFTRLTRNALILSGGRGLRNGWLRPGWL